MSAGYGKVPSGFWNEAREMSDAVCLLELYLRTCTHRSKLGLFVLDPLYAVADMNRGDAQSVRAGLAELHDAGRVGWDEKARVVYLRDVMEVDPPTRNEAVVKSALAELANVPRTSLLLELLADVERALGPRPEKHYATLQEGVRGVARTVSPSTPEPSPHDEVVDARVDEVVDARVDVPPSLSPSSPTPSPTPQAQPAQDRREVSQSVEEVWRTVKPVVLERWHRGADEIVVNGSRVGLGAEKRNVEDLVALYGPEETAGIIEGGPGVLGMEDGPVSLRVFTHETLGPGNVQTALSAWRRRQDTAPRATRKNGLQPLAAPAENPARRFQVQR